MFAMSVRVRRYSSIAVVLMASGAVASESEPVLAGGPAIPGVCVLDQEALFSRSKVGQDVTAQYRVARDAAQEMVKSQEGDIAADAKALKDKKAALPDEQYQMRQRDLAVRVQALRLEAAHKSQELEAVRKSVVQRIAKEAQPFVAAAYQKYRCSLLLSRTAVLAGNPGMDVTAEVIKGIDGKITAMAFMRGEDGE